MKLKLNELFFSGFVKVGSDTYLLREDRIGDECQDYYDNCGYKKSVANKTENMMFDALSCFH